MQAIILAGGKGIRLRPYTNVLPKPLMPVGDYPIIEIILRQLKAAGVHEVIIAVGYLSQLFQAFFQDGRDRGLNITYSLEPEPLGTAGPLALVRDSLENDFLVMNGDLLTTLDYAKMFEFHKKNKAAATIGLYQREVKIDFGVIETDAENKLVNYVEKPTYHFSVSMGVNIFHTEVVKPYLKPGQYLDIPTLMQQLQEDGHPVHCYSEDCYWLDIGRIDDYQLATEVFESHKSEFLRDGF